MTNFVFALTHAQRERERKREREKQRERERERKREREREREKEREREREKERERAKEGERERERERERARERESERESERERERASQTQTHQCTETFWFCIIICVVVRDRASERQQETIIKSLSGHERHSGVAAQILRVAGTSAFLSRLEHTHNAHCVLAFLAKQFEHLPLHIVWVRVVATFLKVDSAMDFLKKARWTRSVYEICRTIPSVPPKNGLIAH